MTRFVLAAAVALGAALAACETSQTGPRTDRSRLSVAPDDPAANASVSGKVLGVTRVDGADLEQPLGGATVKVLEIVFDPGQDTTLSHLVGTMVTDGAGAFELTDIPVGEYLLQAYPPPGSGFAGTTEWAVSSDGGTGYTAVIRLYKP